MSLAAVMRCILDELSVCFYRGALVLIAVPSAPLENHGRSLLRWCYSINNKNKKSYCATLYSEPWTWETVENVGTFFLVLSSSIFVLELFLAPKCIHTQREGESTSVSFGSFARGLSRFQECLCLCFRCCCCWCLFCFFLRRLLKK